MTGGNDIADVVEFHRDPIGPARLKRLRLFVAVAMAQVEGVVGDAG